MENFKRKEFACKCGCGFSTVDYMLAKVLDDLRNHFDKPVIVTSGCRCETHNKTVGGATQSTHLFGIAGDIKVKGIAPKEVYKYLDKKYPDTFGIGLYISWVHIDVRFKKARWSS